MASLKEIKENLKVLLSTIKTTSSMKLVSAAKFKKLQNKSNHAFDFLMSFISLSNLIKQKDGEDKKLLIIISSDKGLCAGYNYNIKKHGMSFLSDNPDCDICYIGKKVDLKKEAILRAPIKEMDNIEKMKELVSSIKDYGHIDVLFTQYNSITDQNTVIKNIREYKKNIETTFILRETHKNLVEYFLISSITCCILHALLCEYSTRMLAMDKATHNAEDMIDELRLTYNKIRQSKITSELSETISGSLL